MRMEYARRPLIAFASTFTRLAAAVVAFGALLPSPIASQTLEPLGLEASGRVTYFIAEGARGSQYRAADRDLAAWALKAWETGAGGVLRFEPSSEADALVRVYWVPASDGQYGEMQSLMVKGRRGAAVYIRPDTDALGPDIARLARADELLRDTIVYLTCLHEL